MNKVEIKQDPGTNQGVLVINDKTMFCAYKSPAVTTNQMGMPAILQLPCTDACPLFRVDAGIISINCGCEKVIYKMDFATKMSKF